MKYYQFQVSEFLDINIAIFSNLKKIVPLLPNVCNNLYTAFEIVLEIYKVSVLSLDIEISQEIRIV